MNRPEQAAADNPDPGFRIFRSFQNPAYRFYLPGSLLQFAALSMQIVTGPMLMYRLTDSKALLGTMALVSASPMIVVSLFGGAIADRFPKKKVIVTGLMASAVLALGIALSLDTGYVNSNDSGSWWVIFAAVFLMGIIMGFMMPALQAMVAEIVHREHLMNAVALNTMGMNILNLIAPSVAGVMIDQLGFESVYYTMIGLYIGSAFLISFIHSEAPVPAPGTGGSNILREIREGFRYIRSDRVILFVLAFSLLATVLSMPYQQLLPIYVDDILKIGATGMGLLMSVSGAGALVGSIILTALPNKKRGLMLLASGIISGTALVVFSFSTVLDLSLAVMVFVGLGQTLRMTIGSTLLQAYSSGEYRGRVMSIFSMQWGLMSVCTFVAGVLAEFFRVEWILGSLAIILIAAAVLSIGLVPSLRKLD